MLAALAVAALAAPAPSDLREAPKAREPIFAPAPTPCDAGFVPTCEQAKGFGLCDTTNSACDTACVDEVKMTCPVTCSLSAEATSGHLEPDATPSDYGKHLPPAATEAICSTCADHPDLPCCHDHPHESNDRRRLQSDTCVTAINDKEATLTIMNSNTFLMEPVDLFDLFSKLNSKLNLNLETIEEIQKKLDWDYMIRT